MKNKWKSTIYFDNQLREDLKRLIPSNLSGTRVLDVGCGADANMSIAYAKKAARKASVEIAFRKISFGKNNFPDKKFDIVVCAAALHHMIDKQFFFKEANRILVKNGDWQFAYNCLDIVAQKRGNI